MSTFKKGSLVRHDFSGETGKVTATRRDKDGYNYFVEWFTINKCDWYKIDVLRSY